MTPQLVLSSGLFAPRLCLSPVQVDRDHISHKPSVRPWLSLCSEGTWASRCLSVCVNRHLPGRGTAQSLRLSPCIRTLVTSKLDKLMMERCKSERGYGSRGSQIPISSKQFLSRLSKGGLSREDLRGLFLPNVPQIPRCDHTAVSSSHTPMSSPHRLRTHAQTPRSFQTSSQLAKGHPCSMQTSTNHARISPCNKKSNREKQTGLHSSVPEPPQNTRLKEVTRM